MRLLFIDTETGGLNPQEDALFEVALIVWEDGKRLARKVWKIKSGDKCWNQAALEINNIDIKEHNVVAIDQECAAHEIVEFINEWFPRNAATLAGHNVSFDRDFLKVFIEEFACTPFHELVSHRLLDTMSVLNFLVAFGQLPPEVLSSDGAFKHFNIEVTERHTALGDTDGTIQLFDKLGEFIQPLI